MYKTVAHVHAARGTRMSMEDTHCIIGDLLGDGRAALFCIFDGHAGRHVSAYLRCNYPQVLRECIAEVGLNNALQALEESFKRCDAKMLEIQDGESIVIVSTTRVVDDGNGAIDIVFDEANTDSAYEYQQSGSGSSTGNGDNKKEKDEYNPHKFRSGGSTAAVVLLVDSKTAYVANCGDAEAILHRKPTDEENHHDQNDDSDGDDDVDDKNVVNKSVKTPAVVCMTVKHKPTNQAEGLRIHEAGGLVSLARVNGTLAVSRSFGDFDYTGSRDRGGTPIVIADPHLAEFDVHEGDMMVIACDGLYDVFSYSDAAAAARCSTDTNIAKTLVTAAINERNSTDNVSVIVVRVGGRAAAATTGSGAAADVAATTGGVDGGAVATAATMVGAMDAADKDDKRNTDDEAGGEDDAIVEPDIAPSLLSPRPLSDNLSWADMEDGDDDEEAGVLLRPQSIDEDDDEEREEEKEEEEFDSSWSVVVKKKKKKIERQCAVCCEVYGRKQYSYRQWNKGESESKCLGCANQARREYEATLDEKGGGGGGTVAAAAATTTTNTSWW